MTGYKIPKGFVEGYRNAIERYPKDSQYAWGMNAVVEALEVHPLEELDENPWHTGTPKEEGWYLVKCNEYSFSEYITDYFRKEQRWVFGFQENYVAWQKIEPYKEKEINPCDCCQYYRSEVDLCVAPDRDECKRR